MFPNTMSDSPLNDATKLTTNSGADVPKATIVNPITKPAPNALTNAILGL